MSWNYVYKTIINQSTNRLGPTGISIYSGLARRTIISFCYVFIAQPEPKPPQIFCDPEAVHLMADVKNSIKMCCMLRLLPSYYNQNVFRLFRLILHTPFLEIKKISSYSSALLLLQLMYYIYREDVNIKTQASGCYLNHYGYGWPQRNCRSLIPADKFAKS